MPIIFTCLQVTLKDLKYHVFDGNLKKLNELIKTYFKKKENGSAHSLCDLLFPGIE